MTDRIAPLDMAKRRDLAVLRQAASDYRKQERGA